MTAKPRLTLGQGTSKDFFRPKNYRLLYMSANPHTISSKSPAQQPFFCADCDRELKPGEGVTKKDRRVICAACEKKLQDRAEAGRQRSMFVEQESLFNPEGYRDESGQFHPIRASKDYNEFLAGDFEPRKLTAKQEAQQREWERQETEKLKAELSHKRSLAQFVRAQGGIVPGGMFAGEIRRLSYKDTGTTGLINQKARQGSHKQTAEYVMDAANAEGYRDRHGEPFTSISDFLLAVEDSAVKGIDRFRAKGPTAKQRREKRLAKAMRETNPLVKPFILKGQYVQAVITQDRPDSKFIGRMVTLDGKGVYPVGAGGRTFRLFKTFEGAKKWGRAAVTKFDNAARGRKPNPIKGFLGRFKELRAEEKRAIAGARLKGSLEAVENQIKEVSLDSWYRKPENKHLQKLALDRLKFRKAEVLAKMKKNPKPRTVSQKISQLTREGYPHKQAIAIALDEQRAGKVNPAGDVHIDAGHVTIVKGKSTVNPRRKPKFKVGDKVYSYQNKDYKAAINFVHDNGEGYAYSYRLSLGPDKDGYFHNSNWINEESLSRSRRNPAKTVSQARAKVAQKADYLYRRADALEKAGKPIQARAAAKRTKALLDAVWRSGKHSEGPVGRLPNPWVTINMIDYLKPNGKYPYSQMGRDMERALEAGNSVALRSVPGFTSVTGQPDPQNFNLGYVWRAHDLNFKSAQDAIDYKRGITDTQLERKWKTKKRNPYDPFYGEPEPRKRKARKPKAENPRLPKPYTIRTENDEATGGEWATKAEALKVAQQYANNTGRKFWLYKEDGKGYARPVRPVYPKGTVNYKRNPSENTYRACPRCKGTGKRKDGDYDCASCNGMGVILVSRQTGKRVRTPGDVSRQKNPSIKDIAEKFQGKTNGNVAEFKASSSAPANLARIGRLVFLKVAGRQIRVPGAMVAADGRERLWIVGNRTPLFNTRAKPGTAKDYGSVDAICYLTAKAHIGEGKRYEYVHEFGEEGGRKPHLLIDSEGMPILRGGDYKIKAEGIVN